MLKIILASTSSARKMLLDRLQIPFECIGPNVDETPLQNEDPASLVKRLAKEKAEAVAKQFPDSLIIGADEVGIINDVILSKPMTEENAIEQLKMLSGETVTFYTGICVLNTKTNEIKIDMDTFDVSFRQLSEQMIKNYLRKENALECAGSLKVEGFGISLIEKLAGDDYTSLIGLPLIKLTKIFEVMGMPLI